MSLSKVIQEYYVTDVLMSDVTSWNFYVQCKLMDPSPYNSMAVNPLNATDSSSCMRHLSSLACLTSVRSDHLPSCSLWRQHCSLAPDAICFSHSVHSSALSYTVRSPPSWSIAQNIFRMCANLKCTLPSFPFVQLKFSVYGHTQTDRKTYTHVLQMQSR